MDRRFFPYDLTHKNRRTYTLQYIPTRTCICIDHTFIVTDNHSHYSSTPCRKCKKIKLTKKIFWRKIIIYSSLKNRRVIFLQREIQFCTVRKTFSVINGIFLVYIFFGSVLLKMEAKNKNASFQHWLEQDVRL